MKLSSTLLAAPLLAVAQAQGQGDYNSICPSQADGKPHEINPGYFVEFKCETLGPNSGAPVGGITSAKDCAKTCQNAVGCNGSSWVSSLNLCYLDKGSSGSESAHSKTVYMKHVAQQCASCNKELADVKKQLAECKAQVAKPAGGSNYCQGRQGGPNVPPFVIDAEGKKYRVWCNLSEDATNNDTILSVTSSQECAERCNKETKFTCRNALWLPNGTCYLRTVGTQTKPPRYVEGQVTMQRV